jgi:dihydroorotate dehydrogenase electron transfer subunit
MASAQLIKRQPAPTREFTGTITERMPVMGDAWLVTFTAPKELCAAARAGNFVNVLPHDHDVFDPPLRRPFSVYSVDVDAGLMTLLVRPYGRGSGWIVERQVGSEINVLGLLGNAFELEPKSTHALMVAGGVGAAPLLMLAREAVARGVSVTYLMGAHTTEALLEASELPDEVEYVVATEDGSAGYKGFVTDLVPNYLTWADQVFTCGPTPMFYSLRQVVLANRIGTKPPVQVSVERTMACGVGACLGCMVETRRGMKPSCVDGPVFHMEMIRW